MSDPVPYEYEAVVEKIIDGDSIWAVIDLGFSTFRREKLHLLGVDAPEIYGEKKESLEHHRGRTASSHLSSILPVGTEVYVRITQKEHSYYLAEVITRDGTSINEQLVKMGYGDADS